MTPTMEDNEDLVRQYLNAFNDRDRDALSDLLADDVVHHGAPEEITDFDEFVEYLDANFDAFSDYSGTTDDLIAGDEAVTVRYRVRGTHEGEYRGIEPTGEDVEWTGIAIYRIEDDEIAEVWLEEDRLGLLRQLGVVDPPAR